MKSYKKDQHGFGAVEALLIVVIVALLVFVGWYVYNSNKKANNTINAANQANSSANSVSLSSTKTSTAAGTKGKLVATELLAYAKANPKTALKTYVDKHVNDFQFTTAFKAAVDNGSALASNSVNPVYCSATAPTGFKVASSKLNGSTATVVLDQVSSSNVAQSQVPQLTLQYAHGTWSVDQYSCVAS